MRTDWSVAKLETVITQFIVPQRDRPKVFDGDIPWCRIEDFDGIYLSKSKSGLCVSQELIESMPLRVYPKNTVIVSCSADLGRCAIIATPLITNQTFIGLVPSKEIDSLYLYYLMGSKSGQLNEMATGATIKYLSKKKFQELEIPIPSLNEQKEIVAIIDEAFEAIDTARANLEKNIKNTKELFKSKTETIFGEIESKILLSDVCDEIFAGGDAPKNNFSKDKTEKYSIPIIANAVKDNGLYGYTDLSRVTKPSITIAARGSGTGHTEIRNEPFFPIVRLIVLTPNTNLVNLDYLKYAIKNLEILRSGSAIPQLTVPMIKKYVLPVPNLTIQESIIKQLNQLEKQLDEINHLYTNKLNALDELKKSILQKAFTGELTQ